MSNYFRHECMDAPTPEQQAIEQLQEDVEELKNTPIKNHVMSGEFYGGEFPWYHVDNIEGSDDNDGRTWTTSLKTLDKAIEKANESGRHDLRIALVESPEDYILTASTIATQALHISGFMRSDHSAVSDHSLSDIETNKYVKLLLANTARPTAFYTTHNNFDGLVIYKNPVTAQGFNTHFYSDGGFSLFTKCAIVPCYIQNGGTVWFDNCVMSQLVTISANTRVKNELIFTVTPGSRLATYRHKITINGGVFNNDGLITFRGSVDAEEFINARNTLFTSVGDGFVVGQTNAEYTFNIDNSALVLAGDDRAKFIANGQHIYSGDTLLFTGSTVCATGAGAVTTIWADMKAVQYTE